MADAVPATRPTVTPRRFLGLANPSLRVARKTPSAKIGWSTWTAFADWRRTPTTPPSRRWRDVARQQITTRRPRRLDDGHQPGPGLGVRCPGQADTRIQASAPQRAAHRLALNRLKNDPSIEIAPRIHFSRQGRTRLHHGEADHQADQRHRTTVNNDPESMTASGWHSCRTSA